MTQVLDHGFVRMVDHMGDDLAVVQAARTSYGEGTKTPSDDRSLIRYLMRHWHTTPFEMVEFKWHIRLPLFVAGHLVRHRTANINAYSGRFSIMPDLFYVPDPERIGAQSTTNKQGTGEPTDHETAVEICEIIENISKEMFAGYSEWVGTPEQPGPVSRELARIILPQNNYTDWTFKMDLHNLMHLMRLRLDHHTQWETRQYAQAMFDQVAPIVPICIEAFEDYRLYGASMSRAEMDILRRLVRNSATAEGKPDTMSKSEWREFLDKMTAPV